MKISANFNAMPSGLNMGTYFTRAQFNFVSLTPASDMFIRSGSGKNALELNLTGIRVDFVLPTDTINVSMGCWADGTIDVIAIDDDGIRTSYTFTCDHVFTDCQINGVNLVAIEFMPPRPESYLEQITIDVNFC